LESAATTSPSTVPSLETTGRPAAARSAVLDTNEATIAERCSSSVVCWFVK